MVSKYVRNLQDEDEVVYEGKGKKPMGSGADTSESTKQGKQAAGTQGDETKKASTTGAKKLTPKRVVEAVKTIGKKGTSNDSNCAPQ